MKAKNVAFAGLFIALGVLVPQVFHLVGGPGLGRVFLPMHLSVLVAGFVLSPSIAVLVGVLTPICSFLYTGGGMPPVPTLYFMMIELGVYGMMTSVLFRQLKGAILPSLVGGMITGRVVHTCVVLIVTKLIGIALPASLGIGAILSQSIPGIVLQLIVLPPLLYAMKKKGWLTYHDQRNTEAFTG